MNWCHFVIAVFKIGCVIGFTIATFTCFAKGDKKELSEEVKKTVRSNLYSLLESDEARKRNRTEKRREQRELRERIRKMLSAMEDIDKYIEDSIKTEASKEAGDSEELEEEWVLNYKKDTRLKSVFAVRNSSYVKTLVQNDSRLREWIKKNPEMLFFAIQFGNLDLVRFFVEEGGMINAVREFTHFSPLHMAIIAARPRIIQFFLDHPETNLRQKSIWGNNIFHIVFFSGPQGDKGPQKQGEKKANRLRVLEILFQEEYFSKISDLLNTPSSHSETALDFALGDEMHKKKEVIALLRSKKALRFEELPENQMESLERRNTQKIYSYPICAAQFSSSLEFSGVSLE